MSFFSNDFATVELNRVAVSDDLYIYENRFSATVVLEDVLSTKGFVFNSNTIDGQGHLKIGSGAAPGPTPAIEIANNVVKGYMGIELDIPALHELLSEQTTTAERDHPVIISFERSTFDGGVSIGRTTPGATLAADGSGPERPAQSGALHSERARDYCFLDEGRTEKLRVYLNYAKAERIEWRLPLGDCRFRWMGRDFQFRTFHYLGGRGRTGPWDPASNAEAELVWRFQLHRPEPSALLAMAENAEEGGRSSDARQLRYEAKSMHYRPSCNNLALAACVGGWARYSYYWLSGFGVKPERLALMLVGVWLSFSTLYYVYYTGKRKEARCKVVYHVPRGLIPLLSLLSRQIGWNTTRVGEITDHGDPPPGFLYRDGRKSSRDFSLVMFSLDTLVPFLNLHLYDTYYPEKSWVVACTYVQHAVGWFFVTVLLTYAAVL